jgi:hypothetical protein
MRPVRCFIWIAAVALTSACGGGGGGSAPNDTPATAVGATTGTTTGAVNTSTVNAASVTPADPVALPATGLTNAQAKDMALALWRNDDLSRHPKGSCAGCHGADFFDLARIGTSDTDLERRATIDGASPIQAKALVQAIKAVRGEMNLPVQNARSFRPLQPGGSVLLPDLTDAPHIVAVKRDIAFGNQLKALLPTLMTGRIDSLSKAKQARAELIDLAQGSNTQGKNTRNLNMRSLPTGMLYPRWSADFHHGAEEGTFNDWTADIAHDPKPEFKTQWLALQSTYLANPSNENFWKMYFSARDMTRLPLLGSCSSSGLACAITDDFNKHKFLSAMMGQHLMRLELAGKVDTFAKGAVAFSYLDTDPTYSFMKANNTPLQFLPAPLWEVGDNARVLLASDSNPGSFKQNLANLGFPTFAQNSIDPNRTAVEEENSLRLPWFWIGFTFDPSLSRISKSNATRVGEYMVGSLIENRYFNHNALITLMRLATKGTLPEANVQGQNRMSTLIQLKPKYLMEYSYAWAYNRTVLSSPASLVPQTNLWNEDRNTRFPADLKAQSEALFAQLAGNGFRMSMFLQMEQLDKTGADALTTSTDPTRPGELEKLRDDWLNDQINVNSPATPKPVIKGGLYAMYRHFAAHHPATLAADEQLIVDLMTKLGLTTKTW